MTRRTAIPPREAITPTAPLRLEVAAALAYPDGSMTAAGLRRERARGRLVIERVAGKDYTTLAEIEEMRRRCRVLPKVPDCGSNPPGTKKAPSKNTPSGPSEMEREKLALAALQALVRKPSKRSEATSRKSTVHPESASVIPIKS